MSHPSGFDLQLRRVGHWASRYVTPVRFISVMAVLCFLIAWNRDIALLYGLSALLLSLLVVSWILPWWVLRGTRVVRQQQGIASAGRELTLKYRFVSARPLWFLTVGEQLPGYEGLQKHFLPQTQLLRQETLTYSCPQRGCFCLDTVWLARSWPFGFLPRHIEVPCEPAEITVVPRVHRIRSLPQPVAGHVVMEGADSQLSRGAHSDFAGVRPYRQGDSLKYVHWSASARQQQMVVREYHSFDHPSWLMVVDGCQGHAIGEGAESSFELALQIAASVMEYARAHQYRFTLFVSSEPPVRLQLEPGMHSIMECLETLAAVQDNGAMSYEAAVQQALSEQDDTPVLITVRRDSQTLNHVAAGGLLDIVYNDASFEAPLGRYAEGWKQLSEAHYRLDLHRLSSLSQVLG